MGTHVSGRSSNWSQTWQQIASPELTAALAAVGTVRTLSDGQLLYQRGSPGHELFGVKSGLVRVCNVTADGYEVLIGLYTPGTWFGEVTLFDDLPRPVSTYAVGSTELLVVPAERLRALLDANPVWYRDFARVICNKLRLALLHIESGFLPITVRIGLRLLDLGRAFGETVDQGVLIRLKLPQDDLAGMLGLARQSVNKELKRLEQQGLIAVRRGQITLCDLPGLAAEVRLHGGGDLLAQITPREVSPR